MVESGAPNEETRITSPLGAMTQNRRDHLLWNCFSCWFEIKRGKGAKRTTLFKKVVICPIGSNRRVLIREQENLVMV